MAIVYKGRELELPLSDENREFLVARSKDTLIAQLDREWANIKHHQDEMDRRKAEAESSEVDTDEDDDEDPDYDLWTVAELTTEIEARNQEEGREEPISTKGKKDELVARIREDDARETSAE
jgi:hypothetical protein